MILRFSPTRKPSSPTRNTTTCNSLKLRSNSIHQWKLEESKNCSNNSFCLCGRRRFLETAATSLSLLPIYPSNATDLHPDDPMAMLNRVHPPRPDCYEEFYAAAMDKSMKSYEAEVGDRQFLYKTESFRVNLDQLHGFCYSSTFTFELSLFFGKIAGYKSQLFANLRGKAKEIVEIGIGTGPNIKYYGSSTGTNVFAIDPNKKMEKYAQAAAKAAGFSSANFKFIQAVAEALPLSDASVDAVVGTLVLCSVTNVATTLQEVRRVLKPGGLYIFVEHVAAKDGTFLRFVQGVLDPLQQTVADGCHLTRKTGMNISAAGFSSVDINTAFLSTASLINPHLYGIAYK